MHVRYVRMLGGYCTCMTNVDTNINKSEKDIVLEEQKVMRMVM